MFCVTSSAVSALPEQFNFVSAVFFVTSSSVSSFSEQFNDVSAVFCVTSSSVSALLAQFNSVSAVKYSMPFRLVIFETVVHTPSIILSTLPISSEDRLPSLSESQTLPTYSRNAASGKLVSSIVTPSACAAAGSSAASSAAHSSAAPHFLFRISLLLPSSFATKTGMPARRRACHACLYLPCSVLPSASPDGRG